MEVQKVKSAVIDDESFALLKDLETFEATRLWNHDLILCAADGQTSFTEEELESLLDELEGAVDDSCLVLDELKKRGLEFNTGLAKLLDEIVDLAENNEEVFIVCSVLRAFHHIKLENRYFKPGKNRYGEWDSEAHNSKIVKIQFGQEEHGGRQ